MTTRPTSIYDKLSIIVGDYSRNELEVRVGLKLQYNDDFTTLYTFIRINEQNKNRKSEFFIKRAFNSLKKDIKQWADTILKDDLIVGQVIQFDPLEIENS